MAKKKRNNDTCPCGSDKSFSGCCQPIIESGTAESAEALMRSRYSAFVNRNIDYLLASWHPDTRPEQLELDTDCQWLGLKILETKAGLPEHENGEVRFVARYRIAGKGYRLEEHSYFEKLAGKWYYHSAFEK